MKNKTTKRLYPCRHCGNNWGEWYLADLCYKQDMENLTKEKEDKPIVKKKLKLFNKLKTN